MFKLIEKDTWKRKPYFDHYFNQIRCTYSITVNIDISKIITFKNKHHTKLYPLLIYALTKAVNNHEEFRTAINDKGELGDGILYCHVIQCSIRKMKPFPICGQNGMTISWLSFPAMNGISKCLAQITI